MLEAAGLAWKPAGACLLQRVLGSLRGHGSSSSAVSSAAAISQGFAASTTFSKCAGQGLRGILPSSQGVGWSSQFVIRWRSAAARPQVVHRCFVSSTSRGVLHQELQAQVKQHYVPQSSLSMGIRAVPYSSESLHQGWANKWKSFRMSLKEATSSSKGTPTVSKSLIKANVATRKVFTESVPGAALKRSLFRYRDAARLQVEAYWKRNYLIVVGAAAVMVCLLLWRIMFGIASTFVGLSEGMAKFGFLALAAAVVAFAGMILRARYTINPDAVYRAAIRKLNASAALLEVLGAPLTGTDVRAYVMSGGGLKLKSFKPRLSGKRCFLIFPIKGSERRGLVSVEAKKKKGHYEFKLLAVDVPTAGSDQRIFLVGDEKEYTVGGGLISELREPIIKAMAAQKEFEEEDEREADEEERQELLHAQEESKGHQKEIAA